ncbi:MAG: XrtA/PEP-CTERM system TPR-repeat protein PrsT [Pseudomonadota bacterium]
MSFSIRNLKFSVVMCLLVALTACDNTTPDEHLALAEEHLANAKPQAAFIELKNAIAKDPRHAPARALLGKTRAMQMDYAGASNDLDKAIDNGDDSVETRVAYLRSRLRQGEINEVVGALEDRTDLAPPEQVMLGEAYLSAGDVAKAKELIADKLNLKEGLLNLAQISFLENDANKALAYANQALKKDSSYIEALLLKAEVQLVLQQSSEAVETFNIAQRNPGARTISRLGVIRAHLVGNDLEAALSSAQSLTNQAKGLLEAHYLKGLVLFRMERWEEAEDALNAVELETREHLPTMHLMAAVKYQLGKLAEAQDRLERYLSEDGSNVSARKLLASIANQQGDFQEVVSLLEPISLQQSDPQVWAMLGSALLQVAEHDSATQALEKAVSLAPDMAAFRNQLALSLLTAGDRDGAVAELENAIEVEDGFFQSDYMLALVRAREGDMTGALEVVDGLIERMPDSPVGYNLLGNINMAADRKEAAKTAFREALTKDQDFFPAARSLMIIGRQEGDAAEGYALLQGMSDRGVENAVLGLIDLKVSDSKFNEALQQAKTAVELFPESAPAWTGLSRLQMAMGQLDPAASSIETALRVGGPNLDTYLTQVDIALRRGKGDVASKVLNEIDLLAKGLNHDPQAMARIAQAHLRMNNLSTARRFFQQSIKASDEPSGDVLVGMAKLELADNNFSRAQQHIDALVARGLTTEQVGLLQGDLHIARDNFEAAHAQFSALADQGSRTGATRLVMLMLQREEFSQALATANKFLEEAQDDRLLQNLRSTALVHLGDLAAAKSQYESMMPTSDPVVLNNLAWIYMREGDPKALEVAEQANKAAPNNPDIEDTLGWILVQEGRVDEGLRFLESSASTRPDNGSVQYHLGIAYQRAGKLRQAERALKRALSLGSFDEMDDAESVLNSLSAQS